MNINKLLKSALFASVLAFSSYSQSNLLLTVDLSVEDEITINSTTGVSLATFTTNDILGVYLDGFFNTTDVALSETVISGDFRHFGQTSDGTPNLFRGTGDTGLNIWSMTNDSDTTILAGEQVFAGSATFGLNEDIYDLMLSTAISGMIYAPADTFDDISGAALIGSWEVLRDIVDVSAPTALLLLCGPLVLLLSRKR